MCYANESSAEPEYIDGIENLYVDIKIKNLIKEGQLYKLENDFEESISDYIINNHSNVGTKPFESNLITNEEDPNIYYHTFGKIDNKNSNLLSSKECSLFEIDINNHDKPKKNSNFRNNIRHKERKSRYFNNDNIRRIIKRRFFNTYLKKALNKKMKKLGYKKSFRNFPQKLVSEITKKKNKELMYMTLFQIFEKNDSYTNRDLINFEYNLNIVKKIKNDEKAEMNLIMNKKFYELFEEYINSDEFKKEIERLNSKHNENFYLQRYEFLAQTFVRFYWQ